MVTTGDASDNGISTRGEKHGKIFEKILNGNGAATAYFFMSNILQCCIDGYNKQASTHTRIEP